MPRRNEASEGKDGPQDTHTAQPYLDGAHPMLIPEEPDLAVSGEVVTKTQPVDLSIRRRPKVLTAIELESYVHSSPPIEAISRSTVSTPPDGQPPSAGS